MLLFSKMKQITQGGTRAGAGRKSLGKVRLVLKVTKKTFGLIDKSARARVISRGEFVDSLL